VSVDVLRYWLGMVRHEEALRLRVRAAPPVPADRAPRLDLRSPGRGQVYFKIACGGDEGGEQLLTGAASKLTIEVRGDRGSFFEHWLRSVLFTRRLSSQGGDVAEGPIPMIGFPVIFNARKGELSTILRRPLSALTWRDVLGDPWKIPSARRRSLGEAPGPPATVDLVTEPDAPGELPYSFDELERSEDRAMTLVRALTDAATAALLPPDVRV
jgi:hypothetical protein